MMRRDERWCLLLIFTFLAGLTTNLLADQQPPPVSRKKETPDEPPGSREPAEHLTVTRHSITIDGRTLEYTATAGCLPLENESGKLQARMFFVAYTVKSASPADRPIAFAFNGGPGAASVFLQVGGIGPKRCPLAKHGTALPGEYRLVDNPWTWLRFTDLVFVDPVGTGYSRAAAGVDAKSFYGVDADIQAAAKFVRLYVSMSNDLAEAMTLNPRLRVYGAAGYYDLTTPYLGQQYTYDHLPIAADLRENLTFSVYRSGHQIYVSGTPLNRLTDDVGSFFRKASTIRPATPADRGDVAAARENR